jgi:hypothetical protein
MTGRAPRVNNWTFADGVADKATSNAGMDGFCARAAIGLAAAPAEQHDQLASS